MLASIVITRSSSSTGSSPGSVYGLLAMGIVLVYRSTRVINFAVGNMGLVGAGLLVLLAVQYGVPVLAGGRHRALVVGTLYGAIIELIVIRRLFDAPRVIVLVATIGIAQLSLAILAAYPDDRPTAAPVPAWPSARRGRRRRSSGSPARSSIVIVVVPLVALALGWFLNRTHLGKTVKASAENRDLARLSGINPKASRRSCGRSPASLATLVADPDGGGSRGSAARPRSRSARAPWSGPSPPR